MVQVKDIGDFADLTEIYLWTFQCKRNATADVPGTPTCLTMGLWRSPHLLRPVAKTVGSAWGPQDAESHTMPTKL